MNVKPLQNRVLIKPQEKEEKTKGGIYLPDTAREKTQQGVVMAVGDGKDIVVKIGDAVLYENFSGTEINIDGVKHIVIDIKDVIARLE